MSIQKVIKTTKVPIKIWTGGIEKSALEQAITLANVMPMTSHLALMPDVHPGKGMPIGGVLPLVNAISPNCVGVDIGCGVLAIKTNLHEIDIETLGKIFKKIRHTTPIGTRGRRKGENRATWSGFDRAPDFPSVTKELNNARKQLGTLGGGNHFIEIQKGDDGCIWWMIHSGSRNIGFKVAQYYHKLAITEGVVPKGQDHLAYFEYYSNIGREYFEAMTFCLEFAHMNRLVMSNDVREAFLSHLDFQILQEVNIHHNYAEPYEMDNGSEVILHRKGATEATKDTIGIIPGSQGSASYIVRGKGNQESYQSCSHGAGRKMSRTMAKKVLNVNDCVATMKSLDLKCNSSRFPIDEAKEAYKDIEEVMNNQQDLVNIQVKLLPYKIPAIKG